MLTVEFGAADVRRGVVRAAQLDGAQHDVRVHRRSDPPLAVKLNGNVTIAPANSLAQVAFALAHGGGAWFWSRATLGGVVHVAVPPQPAAAGFTLELSDGPSYPHLACQPCNGTGPGLAPSAFDYVNSKTPGDLGGKILVRGSVDTYGVGSCVTVGVDKDLDSHTPALEIQKCATTLDSSQVWILDDGETGGTHHLRLRGDTSNRCVDLDMTDRRLEMYSCEGADLKHQQFAYDNATGRFTTLIDGSCMAIVPTPPSAGPAATVAATASVQFE